MTAVPPSFDDRFAALAAVAYRVAFRILGDRGDSEDIAQETLARAYVRWSRVENHVEPWVARVAANQALTLWRRRRRTSPRDARPDVVALDSAALTRLRVVEVLATLPRRQREVVVLRYLADFSEEAVAAHLGCATGTVKQHAHRGLSKLRALLAEEVNSAPTS